MHNLHKSLLWVYLSKLLSIKHHACLVLPAKPLKPSQCCTAITATFIKKTNKEKKKAHSLATRFQPSLGEAEVPSQKHLAITWFTSNRDALVFSFVQLKNSLVQWKTVFCFCLQKAWMLSNSSRMNKGVIYYVLFLKRKKMQNINSIFNSSYEIWTQASWGSKNFSWPTKSWYSPSFWISICHLAHCDSVK